MKVSVICSTRIPVGFPFLFSFLFSKLRWQHGRVSYLRVGFPCQRLQERYQVLLLLGGEIKWPDIAGQPGIFDSAPIVEGDDFPEHLLAAVVHIRTTPGHVTECWRLEGPLIGLVPCYSVATEVRVGFIHAHADIAVILVGEVEPRMAAYTACLAQEERKTA